MSPIWNRSLVIKINSKSEHEVHGGDIKGHEAFLVSFDFAFVNFVFAPFRSLFEN